MTDNKLVMQQKCDSQQKGHGCGGSHNAAGFSMAQAEKVAHHPCYSPSAHHKYARMHLAVAPACNVQCHYCNRKYDCSNESRPGVVSELLNVEQALQKARAVAAAIPQLSVIGIAGPGDPLANQTRTFDTLEGLRSALPDVKLCVSTNGLALPQSVDSLVELGVDHVTITMNAIDAHVSAGIYDWIYFDGVRYRGKEGAQILIDQQIEGMRKLMENGVLVKINSVLIPGVNDLHLSEVSHAIRDMGAFLHNIMPLISKPEHGTHYGLSGQREPTPEEVAQVRERSGVFMPQMAHCQQCRADAVGMLGEDRSQEFNLGSLSEQKKDYSAVMQQRTKVQAAIASAGASDDDDARLVAVATQQGQVIDQHFGHAKRFHIYSISSEGVTLVGERHVAQYCQGQTECDDHDDVMADTLNLLADMDAVFCSRLGLGPWQKLEMAGVQPVVDYAWQPIREALSAWWQQQPKGRSEVKLHVRGVA